MSNKVTLSKALEMILPYWVSNQRYYALSMLFIVAVLNGFFIYINVLAAKWSSRFYDALQALNYENFLKEVVNFLWIALFFIIFFITKNLAQNLLHFKWRLWLTEHYKVKWFENQSYYRMMLTDFQIDNPDQRISADLAGFAASSLNLTITFFSNIANLITFSIMIWTLSGFIELTLWDGYTIKVYGYLLWVVLVYCIITTGVVIWIGSPLVNLSYQQEKFEANFRYNLVRIREKREEIATYRGTSFEDVILNKSFGDIIRNYYQILRQNFIVNAWQNFSLNASTIFPYLIVAPKFFAGIFTLGIVMQIRTAFGNIQESLNVIVYNFQEMASWKAIANRLVDFFDLLDMIEKDPQSLQFGHIKRRKDGNSLIIKDLSIYTPQHRMILHEVSMVVDKGERVLIKGRSGTGKTTLMRSVSGIWPYGDGEIQYPDGETVYIPQRPYMPLGSLRDCLVYPKTLNEIHISDEKINEYLKLFRLEKLIGHLDEVLDWGIALSMGEQQRCAFIRVLLLRPEWLIMDEPSASLDEDDEEFFIKQLLIELPEISLITVSHSPTIDKFHTRVVNVEQWIPNPLKEYELKAQGREDLGFVN